MKKFIFASLVIGLMFALVVVPTSALSGSKSQKGNRDNAANDKATKSLYLYEKDFTDTSLDWPPVEGGAWGKIKYDVGKTGWKFIGHGLMPETDYHLIVYADGYGWLDDPCPVHNAWFDPVFCIVGGTSDPRGRIKLDGLGDFYTDYFGEKIWLVPDGDVDCAGSMTGWDPENILFENNLVGGELPLCYGEGTP